MKKYSKKVIEKSFYSKFEINDLPIKFLTEEEIKEGKQGYVFCPYILQSTVNKNSFYSDEFYEKYRNEHKFCPKCGETKHKTTLMAFVLCLDDLDAYADLNDCTCLNCGDKHKMHDRVSVLN